MLHVISCIILNIMEKTFLSCIIDVGSFSCYENKVFLMEMFFSVMCGHSCNLFIYKMIISKYRDKGR